MRRGCRLQDRGAAQGRSGIRQHVVAHQRSGKEVRLARGGIREHEAFLCHEMRGPTGTGRGGILIAGWRQGQGAGKWEGAVVCHDRHVFFRLYLCFPAFYLEEEFANEYPF